MGISQLKTEISYLSKLQMRSDTILLRIVSLLILLKNAVLEQFLNVKRIKRKEWYKYENRTYRHKRICRNK